MKLIPKPHSSQRRLIEIIRVINAADKPIGARAISDEPPAGLRVGERAIRYNLKIMDELGFTKKEGYSGRILTPLGKRELSDPGGRQDRLRQRPDRGVHVPVELRSSF
jgi:repressor of nif and glnA expression